MFGKRKIKITKGGYSFMLMTLGVGAAGLNTGNNLLYLLFGMMLSFIIISGILSDVSMYKLKTSREIPREVGANALFPVKLVVTNGKKSIPAFSISVEDISEQSGGEKKFIVKVPPRTSHDTFYFAKFRNRGLKRFTGFKLLTKYPFGLIQKTDYLRDVDEILVYPEILDLKRILPGNRMFHGEYLSGSKGIGVNPWGLRDYYHGDDARLIHWKSTAKKGSWMVKEFESEKKLRVVIDLLLINPSAIGAGSYRKTAEAGVIEKLISLCASFIVYLSRSGFEVTLTFNGQAVNGTGKRYISGYMRKLALLDTAQLPLGMEALISPHNGESTHLLITNLSFKNAKNRIPGIGIYIDRDNYNYFDPKEGIKGGVHLEV